MFLRNYVLILLIANSGISLKGMIIGSSDEKMNMSINSVTKTGVTDHAEITTRNGFSMQDNTPVLLTHLAGGMYRLEGLFNRRESSYGAIFRLMHRDAIILQEAYPSTMYSFPISLALNLGAVNALIQFKMTRAQ